MLRFEGSHSLLVLLGSEDPEIGVQIFTYLDDFDWYNIQRATTPTPAPLTTTDVLLF